MALDSIKAVNPAQSDWSERIAFRMTRSLFWVTVDPRETETQLTTRWPLHRTEQGWHLEVYGPERWSEHDKMPMNRTALSKIKSDQAWDQRIPWRLQEPVETWRPAPRPCIHSLTNDQVRYSQFYLTCFNIGMGRSSVKVIPNSPADTPILPISPLAPSAAAPDIIPTVETVTDGRLETGLVIRRDNSTGHFPDTAQLQSVNITITHRLRHPSQLNHSTGEADDGHVADVAGREGGQASVDPESDDHRGRSQVRIVLQTMGPNLPHRKRRKITPKGLDSNPSGPLAYIADEEVEDAG